MKNKLLITTALVALISANNAFAQVSLPDLSVTMKMKCAVQLTGGIFFRGGLIENFQDILRDSRGCGCAEHIQRLLKNHRRQAGNGRLAEQRNHYTYICDLRKRYLFRIHHASPA